MLSWREVSTVIPKGVMVASSEKQEWLLPWWFENYSKHNPFPVTFVDFGLSKKARDFCREKGELVKIPKLPFLGDRKNANLDKAKFWESICEGKSFWDKRVFWHQKPLALLQSPYEKTLWLDTDCEVKASLLPLFEKIGKEPSLLICKAPEEVQQKAKEKGFIFEEETLFNSGVIGFMKGSNYVMQWAEKTLQEHGSFFGDDTLLSRLIYEKKWPIQNLDPLYNWCDFVRGKNADVKISHWEGEMGKFFISMKKLNFLS